MMRLKRAVTAAVIGLATATAAAQMSMDAPAPAPDTQPAPSEAAAPAPAPAAPAPAQTAPAQPSAANVLENLLKDKPGSSSNNGTAVPAPQGGADATAVPALPNVTPAPTTTNRIREGQFIWQRTGHLAKDEKTGNWYFTFDSDGKNMQDPPMQLIPSKFLMAMEDATSNGTQPLRFRVSGQVTEYRGKNYLWVQQMEILRDVNKGLGG